MKKCTVEFLSPGTFVTETTTRDIESWDVARAVEISKDVLERHAARPYGFRFHEYLTAPDIDDGQGGTLKVQPKLLRTSGMYYLHAEVRRYDDIPDDRDHRILRSNMQGNGWAHVVTNNEGWQWTQPLRDDDTVLRDGEIIASGSDAGIVEYRERMLAEWNRSRTA